MNRTLKIIDFNSYRYPGVGFRTNPKVSLSDEVIRSAKKRKVPKIAIDDMAEVFESRSAGHSWYRIINNYFKEKEITICELSAWFKSAEELGFSAWD